MALSEPSIDKENEKQTSDKRDLDDVDESNVQVISEAAGENGFISGSENGSKSKSTNAVARWAGAIESAVVQHLLIFVRWR